MVADFIHLNCHSEYSLVDGLLKIKPWLAKVAALAMPAVALTDQANLFAMVKFYKEALAVGVKPIIGSEVWLENELEQSNPYKITLLCQNQLGYTNLTKLISLSYLQGQDKGKAVIKKTWLHEANAGLLCLAHARDSDIARHLLTGEEKCARILMNYWLQLFPKRFYLGIARINTRGEDELIKQTVALAANFSCPLVATNEVCFLAKDDYEAHEARVCIHEGTILNAPNRVRHYTEQQYLKTKEQMAKLFADLPEALINTVEIAKRCNLTLTLDKVFLPNYPVPLGKTPEEVLQQMATAGLEQKLTKILAKEQTATAPEIANKRAQYKERLQRELAVINKMGFAGYFLIVADFISWAHENKVPVGPGRGSGAGSIVAYALAITALDPIQYDLLFERFLNVERVSLPDFDIDFCMEGRDKVIEYVHNKYGKDSVSQIITFGTMAAKAVIRDVGRVLGHPYGFVDQIAKLIPLELGITLAKALQQEEILKNRYEQEEDVKFLIDLALKLEGITRNVGKHAGGVVIAPSKLTDFVPLYCEANELQPITQFDKYDVENIGLIKFDFLGLRTLTIIAWTLETINAQKIANNEAKIELEAISLTDPKPFQLLASGKTTAIFQLESRGAKDLLKRIPPTCLEDIIALVALNRPGPLQSGMVDDFINRKKGIAAIKYLHPKLEPILQATYGVILYQEQVMRVAQELAGYTLGAADILRSAMGKKKPKEMAKQRKIFIQGAVTNGIALDIAECVFNLMEKFAGYGFNKSHSAAYALITYQTAWLKAHFPAAFMAAVLSADLSNTDKIVLFINDCKALGLVILPPNINQSNYKFSVTNDNTILYGLGAIKGVGEAAIATIIAARELGVFKDLFDFCSRIDLRKVTKRTLEALIAAGALDVLGEHRAMLWANLAFAIQAAEQIHDNLAYGQTDLFGTGLVASDLQINKQVKPVAPWLEYERLTKEKAVLGLYLTGHPINIYRQELHDMGVLRIVDLAKHINKQTNIAGFIVNVRTRLSKRGERMAFITIDDCSGQQDLVVFADLWQKHKELLKIDNLIIIDGLLTADPYSGGIKVTAKAINTLEQLRIDLAKQINIKIPTIKLLTKEFINNLAKILQKHPVGTCPIIFHCVIDNVVAQIRFGKAWLLMPSAELLTELQGLGAEVSVNITYIND